VIGIDRVRGMWNGVMRKSTAMRRALGLPLVLVLATSLVGLDVAPAEAGRIKIRLLANAGPATADKAGEHVNTRGRLPIRFRIRSGSGSSSSSSSGSDRADRQDEKAGPRPPGAAAAAAARARAALAAEKAAQGVGAASAGAGHRPIPLGKTTEYSNGVTCLAGC